MLLGCSKEKIRDGCDDKRVTGGISKRGAGAHEMAMCEIWRAGLIKVTQTTEILMTTLMKDHSSDID